MDFALEQNPLELEPVVVNAPYDAVLDPLATASEQKITEADLRELPVTTLAEALELSAGAVGTSYRGGRIGEESFILDGLGVKNRMDAATAGLGVTIPTDLLSEASLVTNAFSARYGAGAVWAGERRHPRSGRRAGKAGSPTRGIGRSAGRWTVGSTASSCARVDRSSGSSAPSRRST